MRFIRSLQRSLRRASLARHRDAMLRVVEGGEGLHLDGKITLVHGEKLKLGRQVHIGHDAAFNCLGGISIGDHSIISGCVTIYSYDHDFKRGTQLPYDANVVPKPVRIGRYVWIGMNVTIAPGTVIEDGAVIGIGTVVSGHVPANAIVVSQKPRIVGYRDVERTRRMAADQQFFMAA